MVTAEELPKSNHKRSYTEKCKGSYTKTVLLLKLKFESSKCLDLLSQPLKSEPDNKKYPDTSVLEHRQRLEKELGKCSVLLI